MKALTLKAQNKVKGLGEQTSNFQSFNFKLQAPNY